MDRAKVALVVSSALAQRDDVVYLLCAWVLADVADRVVLREDEARSGLPASAADALTLVACAACPWSSWMIGAGLEARASGGAAWLACSAHAASDSASHDVSANAVTSSRNCWLSWYSWNARSSWPHISPLFDSA